MRAPLLLCTIAVLVHEASSLSAADPAPATPGVAVPYRLTSTKHVLVRAKVNGQGPYHFILDTGAPALFLAKSVAEQAGLNTDRNGWAMLESFEIEGGLRMPKVRARVDDLFQLEGMNSLGLAGVELHGVIGYNVLARYRITYDFTANRLHWVPLDFEPPPIQSIGQGGQGGLELLGPLMKTLAAFMGVRPKFSAEPRGHLGIEVEERNGRVVITRLLPASPAAVAGLQPGDVILAVSRTKIVTIADLAAALADARPGDVLRLQRLRQGATATVTLTLTEGL